MLKNKIFRILAGIILMLGMPLIVRAAGGDGFAVNPMSVMISPTQPIQTLVVTNESTRPVLFDAKMYTWERNDKIDSYTPAVTKDVIVTPPVMRIMPNGKQVMRVGLTKVPSLQKESLYRLYLTEIPSKESLDPNASQNNKRAAAIVVAMRIGIPVYIQPVNPVRKLSWDVQRIDKGIRVRVLNLGNTHIRISKITATLQNSSEPIAEVATYEKIFAGELSSEWILNIPANQSGALKISAITDMDTPLDAGKDYAL